MKLINSALAICFVTCASIQASESKEPNKPLSQLLTKVARLEEFKIKTFDVIESFSDDALALHARAQLLQSADITPEEFKKSRQQLLQQCSLFNKAAQMYGASLEFISTVEQKQNMQLVAFSKGSDCLTRARVLPDKK